MSSPGAPAFHATASVEFASILRHALLTPLSGIVLWCDMIRRNPPLSDELDRALTAIDHSARAQVAILDNVVELSRMQSGATQLARLAVDLHTCVDDVILQNSSVARQRAVVVRFVAPDGQLVVHGDPVRLRTAIHNLVENAINHSPRGGTVEVRLEATEVSVLIHVSDEGNGIASGALPDLFKVDGFSEAGLMNRRGGLGLGLPVARWIVALHDGKLTTGPNAPRGCVFTITLPR
jgi:signal transduction histidine kinase